MIATLVTPTKWANLVTFPSLFSAVNSGSPNLALEPERVPGNSTAGLGHFWGHAALGLRGS